MTKREKQALKRLAAKPCAAEVFPREAPGCGNNESFCESCDAKDQLKDQQRIDDSLKLARATGKLAAAMRHFADGDPIRGWRCRCGYFTRNSISAAMHDQVTTVI
jgi:hypothetical protein